jgi:hypothetical protein
MIEFEMTGLELKAKNLSSLVNGETGTGKTHFGTTHPGPYFFVTENKTITGLSAQGVEVPFVQGDYTKLRRTLTIFKNEKPKAVSFRGKEVFLKSLVLDSLTELGPLILDKVLEESGKKNRVMNQDLWSKVMDELRTFIRDFVALKTDYNILVTARPTVFKDEKRGGVYGTPDTIGQFRHSVVGLFDLVFVSDAEIEWENGIPKKKFMLYTYQQDLYAANDSTGLLAPSEPNDFLAIAEKIFKAPEKVDVQLNSLGVKENA